MVLVGRGDMQFAPTPAAERGQLRIFSGRETLDAAFETAFIRLNPSDYRAQVAPLQLPPATIDERVTRRAQGVFERAAPRSFNVDLRDLSPDDWYLLPPSKDFVAEVDTRRHDTLTFTRSSAQAEDVSLFQRDGKKTIALYAVGRQAGGARALLQRRRVPRLRRAGLQRRRVDSAGAAVHPGPRPPGHARAQHVDGVGDAALRRGAAGAERGQRRVRRAAAPAGARPGHPAGRRCRASCRRTRISR